jgi:hypothetical protein
MTRILRPAILAVLILSVFSAVSTAEKTVSINPSPGVYDQPSTVAAGTTVHVAFIGKATVSDPFHVYYTAIDGASDFANLLLTKDTPGFQVTPAVEVLDSTGTPDNVYFDARHPKIALQAPGRIVIFFQAKQSAVSTGYSLYRAQIVLAGNAVSSIRVNLVGGGIPAGDVQDVTLATSAVDNTARLAFAVRPNSSFPFDIYYARVGLDNGSVVRAPIKLSAFPGTTGSRPIPSLQLDGSNRSHIAWTADDGTGTSLSSVYYAMIKEFNDPVLGIVDNAAIAATAVIGRNRRWVHPQVLVSRTIATGLVYLMATAESATDTHGTSGSLAHVRLNPDAALQDNNSVNLGANAAFLLEPPGMAILPTTFDLYRAEAQIDLGDRIHLTGYGDAFSAPVYYAMKPLAVFPFLEFLTPAKPVAVGTGVGSFELPDDYSKAAFAFIGGKGVVFWSGTDNTSPDNRSLKVTGLPTIAEFVVFNESGCSASPGRQGGSTGDPLLLAAPLLFLKIRSLLRRGRIAA